MGVRAALPSSFLLFDKLRRLLIPSLQHLGILFSFVMLADLPISFLAYGSRVEIFGACRDLDFLGGDFLVVSAKPRSGILD